MSALKKCFQNTRPNKKTAFTEVTFQHICKAIMDDKQVLEKYFWFDVAVFPEIWSSLYVSKSQWCHTF